MIETLFSKLEKPGNFPLLLLWKEGLRIPRVYSNTKVSRTVSRTPDPKPHLMTMTMLSLYRPWVLTIVVPCPDSFFHGLSLVSRRTNSRLCRRSWETTTSVHFSLDLLHQIWVSGDTPWGRRARRTVLIHVPLGWYYWTKLPNHWKG